MTRKVPLKAIEEYLNSIGFTIQSTCQAYTDEFHTSFESTTALPSLEEEGGGEDKNQWFYIKNSLLALTCVITAALAAGLTMGLVSQELLDL